MEEEGALYALPVVVGGGRCGRSDLASAMVYTQAPHGRSEVVVEEEDGSAATGTDSRFYVDTLGQNGVAWWTGRRHGVVAVTRQCESRPTPASEPDTQAQHGEARHPQPSAVTTTAIIARYSVRVPLYVLATCIPTYTAYHAQ